MKQEGFSLIELMVAVGIITVINIMIFASYPEFSQKLSLKRTSEEVALIVRQAQAYAQGIKRPVSGGEDYFGFGVNFDKSPAESKSLILFTDLDSDKTYDEGELFQEFKIDTGDYISNIETCGSGGCNIITGDKLDVVYPRATSMATVNNDGNVSYARVTIKSPRGGEKYINIWISGQISVK